MKPKLKEYIPVYGCIKYFRRYFKESTGSWRDTRTAEQMAQYHLVITLLLLIGLIKLIIIVI